MRFDGFDGLFRQLDKDEGLVLWQVVCVGETELEGTSFSLSFGAAVLLLVVKKTTTSVGMKKLGSMMMVKIRGDNSVWMMVMISSRHYVTTTTLREENPRLGCCLSVDAESVKGRPFVARIMRQNHCFWTRLHFLLHDLPLKSLLLPRQDKTSPAWLHLQLTLTNDRLNHHCTGSSSS